MFAGEQQVQLRNYFYITEDEIKLTLNKMAQTMPEFKSNEKENKGGTGGEREKRTEGGREEGRKKTFTITFTLNLIELY